MKISINQPAYLPWLGYFSRIARSDLHVVLDHVQFEKNSFTNRNQIPTKNGMVWLTVPINTKGSFGDLSIKEIEISNNVNWANKHWRTIQQNYSKAPYFSQYRDFFESCYAREWDKLSALTEYLLRFFCEQLEINTEIVFSSDFDFNQTKSDLVLEICEQFSSDQYLSGTMGRDYLNNEAFADRSVEVLFDGFEHPVYPQFNCKEFVSHSAVLDLLFNLGPESARFLRENAETTVDSKN